MSRIVTLLIAVVWAVLCPVQAEEGFPGRAKFPDVPVYEIDHLAQDFDRVVVVDVRSAYEYETLRVQGALHIPVAAKTFEAQVRELRGKTDKPIIFYCNGRSCLKSYQAVKKAEAVGVRDTHAYDAGVFDWVKAHPSRSAMLGKAPVDPSRLIPSDEFKSHLLDPETFSTRALGSETGLLMDVRDEFQRGAAGLFVGKEVWANLDDVPKIKRHIEQARSAGRPVYVYDEVGKQVRWLQYLLEDAGIREYYFMDHGARGFYEQVLGVKHFTM